MFFIRTNLFVCLFFVCALGFSQSIQAQKVAAPKPPRGYIKFESDEFLFGNVVQGQWVEHIFKFKNTGKAALIIQTVQTTCGCTVSKWPKTPILPDQTGQISVVFNTAGKLGNQNKAFSVFSDALNSLHSLVLRGYVSPSKPKEQGVDSSSK